MWVWASSGNWWWTGKPGMLQSMGCKESDTTEQLNWIEQSYWIVPTLISFGFPHNSVGKESAWNAGDPSSIPELGRSTGERIGCPLQYSWASLMAQLVKNPPTMRETWVRSLGWEDLLEKGKATHSSMLAWRIVHGVTKIRTQLSDWTEPRFSLLIYFIHTISSIYANSHLPIHPIAAFPPGCPYIWSLHL